MNFRVNMEILDLIWILIAAAVGAGLGPRILDYLSQRFLEGYKFKTSKQRFRFEKFHEQQSLVYCEIFQKLIRAHSAATSLLGAGDRDDISRREEAARNSRYAFEDFCNENELFVDEKDWVKILALTKELQNASAEFMNWKMLSEPHKSEHMRSFMSSVNQKCPTLIAILRVEFRKTIADGGI